MIAAATTSRQRQGLHRAASRYSVVPVRYRPGERHVLRYSSLDGSKSPGDNGVLFGKLYDSPDRAERAFGVANRVADALLFGNSELRALRPCGYSANDAVVLYPAAAGTPFSSILGRPTAALAHCLSQAGAMLRTLHGDGSERADLHAFGRPRSLTLDDLDSHRGFVKEVKKITRHTSNHIHALLPNVGTLISETLERAKVIYDQMPREPPAFSHGDFKTEHLWVDGGTMTLIDFDTCCTADPALDVGKFLADLQWWYASHGYPGVKSAQGRFLDGYGDATLVGRIARARVYESVLLVRLAVHRTRLFDEDWAVRTQEMVRRSAQILDEAAK
jgi:Ser/Thr protein kinase RdoA (MazF antagonist)